MYEKKYIDAPEGKALVVKDAPSGDKVGNLHDGEVVTVLAEQGDMALIGTGLCGWVAKKYIVDQPPDGDRLEYKLGKYNDTVTVTEADASKRIGARHTVGWMLLRNDLGAQKISPALVELLEAAEDAFSGVVEFVTTNSLFRTSESNKKAGGASGSKHLKGYAADFMVELPMGGFVPREDLAKWAEGFMWKKGWQGGIGVYSGKTEHIHVDLRGHWTAWWKQTSGSNTPGFGGRPVVFKKGHRSPAIEEIQNYLNETGYDVGSIDGVFGEKTESALKAWQKANGLAADGKYGNDTNDVMKLFDWR